MNRTNTITVEECVLAYKQFQSLRKAASAVHLSVSTLRRRLLDGGVRINRPGLSSYSQGQPFKRGQKSKAYFWFKEHRNDRIPHNVQKICDLSGLKRYEVNYFLNARLQAVTALLSTMPKINEIDKFVRVNFGHMISTKAVTSCFVTVDKYNLAVHLEMLVNGQLHRTWDLSWSAYQNLLSNSKTP